jgi:hypothetical protein
LALLQNASNYEARCAKNSAASFSDTHNPVGQYGNDDQESQDPMQNSHLLEPLFVFLFGQSKAQEGLQNQEQSCDQACQRDNSILLVLKGKMHEDRSYCYKSDVAMSLG